MRANVGPAAGFDDLIDEAELDHVHDEREDGHDKDDLDRGGEVLDRGVAHAQEEGGYAGEGERDEDDELHDEDRD